MRKYFIFLIFIIMKKYCFNCFNFKKASSISLIILLMLVSFLVPNWNTFAAVSWFTTSVVQVNVTSWTDNQTNTTATPTPNVVGVSEVKASRTLSVWALPTNSENFTIWSCVVTFTTTAWSTLDELDCSDDAATIDTNIGAWDTDRTASEIADVIDTLTNVSDAAHWALAVTADTATTTVFTTSWTETSATNISFTPSTNVTATNTVTWVIPVTAVAQVSTLTPANVEVWDTFSTTINWDTINFVATGTGVSNVTAWLTSAINASSQSGSVTAVDNTTDVQVTSDVAGTAFTITSSATNKVATQQVVDFIPTNPTDGESFVATINGTDYTYNVVWTKTVAEVVTALTALMDANSAVTCVDNTTKITCTADVAGTAFTYNATTVGSSVDLIITLSSWWNVVSTPNTLSAISFSNWWSWITFYKLEWNVFSSVVVSTWTIMPLEWFLVNNTSWSSVSMYFTNKTWLTPSEKLHSKTLSAWWNLLWTTTNTAPFSTIWSAATSIVDLTNGSTNPNEVYTSFSSSPVYQTWEAYGVFMSTDGYYWWNE